MSTSIATKKRSKKQYSNEGFLESLQEIAKGVVTQGTDTVKQMVSIDQIISSSASQKNRSGDLSEGQELNLKESHEKKQEQAHIEAGLEYHREIKHVGERAVNNESREIEAQLRELMAEIKKLADSSKELQAQFKEVAVEQHVTKPGKYHKNFFEWMLLVIRQARMKVEDSGAWLSAAKNKHGKKGAFWKNAAEDVGGTSFSLSGERVVATQVG